MPDVTALQMKDYVGNKELGLLFYLVDADVDPELFDLVASAIVLQNAPPDDDEENNNEQAEADEGGG